MSPGIAGSTTTPQRGFVDAQIDEGSFEQRCRHAVRGTTLMQISHYVLGLYMRSFAHIPIHRRGQCRARLRHESNVPIEQAFRR